VTEQNSKDLREKILIYGLIITKWWLSSPNLPFYRRMAESEGFRSLLPIVIAFMMASVSKKRVRKMISDIKLPETEIARSAVKLAREVSSPTLFNHVMRCYWFAELFAQQEDKKIDSELMFLSAVLHDLGLTDYACGSHRFEIEGANAARKFLEERGVAGERAQNVWDNIALHTWDVNYFRNETSRIMQLGLAYDVTGVEGRQLDPKDVSEIVERYPRLNFKQAFNSALERELESKQPYRHFFHICTRVAHNRSPLTIVGAPAILAMAPFAE
jgi:cyanamide hydratase family protein with HD domain